MSEVTILTTGTDPLPTIAATALARYGRTTMTREQFLALRSKPRYERGDRVVTWDRASRPVLEGTVYWEATAGAAWTSTPGVCLARLRREGVATVPRSRVRLAPEQEG